MYTSNIINSMTIKSYKTEVLLTKKQANKVNQSFGICRWLYNEYISKNRQLYQLYQRGFLDKYQKHFLSANEFDKYINHYLKNRQEYTWINRCGSKARKKTIVNAETAFTKFFKGSAGFPKFKKKNQQSIKLYFPKNGKGDWSIWRHRIQVPTIGIVRLKELGYFPINALVKNGTISQKANRYFVSITVIVPNKSLSKPTSEPLGVDLGIKDLAVLSNGVKYKNINKSSSIILLEKQLKREQRRLSRKLKNKKHGGEQSAIYFANISKNVLKLQKLYQRLSHIRTNYINQVINQIVKQEPSYIAIEDLNISGMIKNHHLAKAISSCKFYEFRKKLTTKCYERGIELRVVNRFYPSSKICHKCNHIKHKLKLSDRIYICDACGNKIDRDVQAAINLKDAKKYKIA